MIATIGMGLLLSSGARAGVFEQAVLAYDDGSFESAVLADTSSKVAVRFTPPAYPCSLVSCRVLLQWIAWDGPYTMTVYDDDGPGGSPGTVLGTLGSNEEWELLGDWEDLGSGWQGLFDGDLPIAIDEGDFFVSWHEWWAPGEGWALKRDTSSPDQARGWRYDSGVWSQVPLGNLAIRAVVRYPDPAAAPRAWFVNPDGSGDAPTIRAAIDSASSGDTVRVAPGVYAEHDIPLKWGVSLVGDTIDPSVVRIDGQGEGRILSGNFVGWTTKLLGFTVMGGEANHGGGIHLHRASPTIFACVLEGNSADRGGGIYMEARSKPVFRDVALVGNSADSTGGGVRCDASYPRITDCRFEGNVSVLGGGFYARACTSSVISRCEFKGNTATLSGSGLLLYVSIGTDVDSCTFRDNVASGRGGGVYCSEAPAVFRDCVIADNTAHDGGGAYLLESDAEVIRCLFVRNLAFSNGGAFHSQRSFPTLSNCTLSHNRADGQGGGVYGRGSEPLLENSIVSFSAQGAAVVCMEDSKAALRCSDVFGNVGGDWIGCIGEQAHIEGNFERDPLFCDPDSGVFRLDVASPCLPGNHPDGAACGLIGILGAGCMGDHPVEEAWEGGGDHTSRAETVMAGERGGNEELHFDLFPNPMQRSLSLRPSRPVSGPTSVRIFDVRGRLIRDLETRDPSESLTWEGRDRFGRQVPPGVYFLRLTNGATREIKRIMLVP
jgi:predicted outer membrane repeat protein